MEHRWGTRKSFQQAVLLDCPHVGATIANARDLSYGGMFVDTGHLVLSLNAPVVAFSLRRKGFSACFLLKRWSYAAFQAARA